MTQPTPMLVWPRGTLPTLEQVLQWGKGQWTELTDAAPVQLYLDDTGHVVWRYAGSECDLLHAERRHVFAVLQTERDCRSEFGMPHRVTVRTIQSGWVLHTCGAPAEAVELECRGGDIYYTLVGLDDWRQLKPAWGRGMALVFTGNEP